MPSYNKVMIMGNLTRNPELRYTPNGAALCDIGIACNRKYTDRATGQLKEEVTFLDVTLWNKQAENTGKYLQKGAPVFVEGRLNMDTWQDKETGKNRSRLKITGEKIQFLGPANRDGNAPNNYSQSNGNYGGNQQQNSYSQPQNQGFSGNNNNYQNNVPNEPTQAPPPPAPAFAQNAAPTAPAETAMPAINAAPAQDNSVSQAPPPPAFQQGTGSEPEENIPF